MVRVRCATCERILAADLPESQARHVGRSVCWQCRPTLPGDTSHAG